MPYNIQTKKNKIMGYDIRPISEINTIDKSLCVGYPEVEFNNISKDGNFFVVEGETFNTFTHSQILLELKKPYWTEQEI